MPPHGVNKERLRKTHVAECLQDLVDRRNGPKARMHAYLDTEAACGHGYGGNLS